MTIGFRVLTRERKVDAQTVKRYLDLPVANVSDVMNRMSAGGPELRPLHAGGVLAGPALTVKTRPGDNLMVHKALLLAEPGDVIVIDGGGDLTNALMGELMISHAIKVGVAGVVIHGAVRDSAWIKAHDFPVFASGITHRGPYKDGPGEINVPVAFAGMVIEPGDLVIGDDDGVLCVPFAEAARIEGLARAKMEAEARTLANTEAGKLDPKTWVDETLARLGCAGIAPRK